MYLYSGAFTKLDVINSNVQRSEDRMTQVFAMGQVFLKPFVRHHRCYKIELLKVIFQRFQAA